MLAQQLTDPQTGWSILSHQSNTPTGFSGTLFRSNETGELVLSFRSTEFVDDAARDNQATNTLEISEIGWAFGQIADMEAWFQSLLSSGKLPPGASFTVTGYSLGGHLATAFYKLRQEDRTSDRIDATYTFNGAGVGVLKGDSTTLSAVLAEFTTRQTHGNADLFTNSDVRALYELLHGTFRPGATVTTADTKLALSVIDHRLQEVLPADLLSPLAAQQRRSELQLLRTAITRIDSVADYAAYVGTLPDVAPPQPVATAQIAAMGIDYQLAVLSASEHTAASTGLVGNTVQAIAGRNTLNPPVANFYDVYGSNFGAGGDFSAVANSQVHYGVATPVWIEDQPLYRGTVLGDVGTASWKAGETRLLVPNFTSNDFGDTHSLILLVDSLRVQDCLLRMSPGLTTETLTAIFKGATDARASQSAGTQGMADGNALENIVNAMATALGIPGAPLKGNPDGGTWAQLESQGGYSGRNELHGRLQAIHDALRAGQLEGQLVVRPATGDLRAAARNDFGALLAMQDLSPLWITGKTAEADARLAAAWQATHAADYNAWLADKTSGTPVTFTDAWLADRAALMQALVTRNQQDNTTGQVFSAAAPAGQVTFFHYTDPSKGQASVLSTRPSGQAGLPERHIVFGGSGTDLLTGYDNAQGDRLYGGAGDDILNGLAGDDHLEGGTGSDRYEFNGLWGKDRVVDLGGQGQVLIDGVALGEFKGVGTRDTYAFDLGGGQYAGLAVVRDEASSTGYTAVIVKGTDTANTITIAHFDLARARTEQGYLGIRLQTKPDLALVAGSGSGNPYTDPGFDAASINGQARLVEGAGRHFTVYLSAAAQAGDTLVLSAGALAGKLKAILGDSVVDVEGAVITLAAGQSEVVFALVQDGASEDIAGAFSVRHERPAQDEDEDAARLATSNSWNLSLHVADEPVNTFTGDFLARTVEHQGDALTRRTGDGENVKVVLAGQQAFVIDLQGNLVAGGSTLVTDNAIFGTPLADHIRGGAGNDLLSGADGADRLEGGEGADMIGGGRGSDTILGGEGDDFLAGAATPYTLQQLGPGDQWADWGLPPGATPLRSGATWGVYQPGGDGQAIWWGMSQFTATDDDGDVVDGGAGNDVVLGSWGADRLQGGSGNDELMGLAGDDIVEGGQGKDTLYGDGLTQPGLLNSTPAARHGNDFLDGGADDDRVVGQGGADALFGGAGDDWLYGDSDTALDDDASVPLFAHGNDYLDGEHGDDVLAGGGANDTLYGGRGNDQLWGDFEFRHLNSEAITSTATWGNDLLDGEEGDDYLEGGGGADTLFGGAGNDVLWGDLSAALLTEAQAQSAAPWGNDELHGGDGDDVLLGGGGHDRLWGGTGDDELWGDDPDAMLPLALHGNDTIEGGEGRDTLWGGGGHDLLRGGSGNDALDGGEGHDTLEGGDGDDVLLGGAGDDLLLGGQGDDVLFGGDGDDTLDGGAGRNVLMGGQGDDTYLVSSAAGAVTRIADADGAGRIVLPFSLDELSVHAADAAGGATLPPDLAPGSVVILAQGQAVVIDGATRGAISAVVLTDGQTLPMRELVGRTLQTPVRASAGAADAAPTKLWGGRGDDSLQVSASGSEVSGGLGNDSITLDGSANTLYFERGDGRDSVQAAWMGDSQDNEIVLGAGITREQVRLVRLPRWGQLGLSVGGGDLIELPLDAATAADSRFIAQARLADGQVLSWPQLWDNGVFVEGGDGDETLWGGSGAQIMAGGGGHNVMEGDEGDDTYLIARRSHNEIHEHGGANLIAFEGPPVAASDLRVTRLEDAPNTVRLALADGTVVEVPDGLLRAGAVSVRLADGQALPVTELLAQALAPRGLAIQGGAAGDVIRGGAGDDFLAGGAGNDVLDGAGGRDVLYGGEGDDTYVVEPGAGIKYIMDDRGANVLRFGAGVVAATLEVSRPVGSDHLVLSSQGRMLVQVNDGMAGVIAVVEFADGTRLTHAELMKRVATDQPISVSGGDGADELVGAAGPDVLAGGQGDDLLVGGRGDDLLRGGPGRDRYRFAAGDGHDRIEDAQGGLVLEFGPGIGVADLRLVREPQGDGTVWRLWYGEHDSVVLDVPDVPDVLDVPDVPDVPDGPDGREALQVRLAGGIGLDLPQLLSVALYEPAELEGGAGDDTLHGYAGADRLRGGMGDDILLGGRGADTYVMQAGAGTDRIRDHDQGSNIVEALASNAQDLRYTRLGNDLLIVDAGHGARMVIEEFFGSQQPWQLVLADGSREDLRTLYEQQRRTQSAQSQYLSVDERKEQYIDRLRHVDPVNGALSGDGAGLVVQVSSDGNEHVFRREVVRQPQDGDSVQLVIEGTTESDYERSLLRVETRTVTYERSETTFQTVTTTEPGRTRTVDLPPGAGSVGHPWSGAPPGISVEALPEGRSRVLIVEPPRLHTATIVSTQTREVSYTEERPIHRYVWSTTLTVPDVSAGPQSQRMVLRGTSVALEAGDGDDVVDGRRGGVGGGDFGAASFIGDFVDGGDGDDVITLGAGMDELSGGQGNDTLDGGAGGDTYVVDASDGGWDLIVDSAIARAPLSMEIYDYGGFDAAAYVRAYVQLTGSEPNVEEHFYFTRYTATGEFAATLDNLVQVWRLAEQASAFMNKPRGPGSSLDGDSVLSSIQWDSASLDRLNDYLATGGVLTSDADVFRALGGPLDVVRFSAGVSIADLRVLRTRITLPDGAETDAVEISWGGPGGIRVAVDEATAYLGTGIERYEFADGTVLTQQQMLDGARHQGVELGEALPAQATEQGAHFRWELPAQAFVQTGPGTPVLTVTLADGSPLPHWLQFDAQARVLHGVPDEADVGSLSLAVQANLGGAEATQPLELVVADVNVAPVALQQVQDQQAQPWEPFILQLPENVFVDADAGDRLHWSASGGDGEPLPWWLSFDEITRTLVGTAIEQDLEGVTVTLSVTDLHGASAHQDFNVMVVPPAMPTTFGAAAQVDHDVQSLVQAMAAFAPPAAAALTPSSSLQDGRFELLAVQAH